MPGVIYCGDNREVLDEYIPRESVDLIYLDPPFNSQRTFNIIYKDQRALEEAFKDHWSWDEAAPLFAAIVDASDVPRSVRTLLSALKELLVEKDADQLAYLTMMTPRLVAVHRALKATGSMYLHCDPTASHYLKVILDAIFGAENFMNEIVWKRTNAHNDPKRFGRIHDVLLFYRKSDAVYFHPTFQPLPAAHVAERFNKVDPKGRRYKLGDPCGPGPRGGDSGKPWMGFDPTERGRAWAPPRKLCERLGIDNALPTRKKLDALHAAGRIEPPKAAGSIPMMRIFLEDEGLGTTLQDVWGYHSYTAGYYEGDPKSCIDQDVAWLGPTNAERLGYPTQKPVGLLARIIRSSCPEGGLVLDPFCGCGTTVEAAERLGRRWIGIDVALKAVDVIEKRFKRIGLAPPEIVWHPADPKSAGELAARDKGQFEEWVLRKLRAARLRKRDRGIDGEAFFKDAAGSPWHVLVSVKGGKHLAPSFVRDLRGTLEREQASVGVLVSMFEPSKEMRLEATRAGFLEQCDSEGRIPRIQLVTVEHLFSGAPALRVPGVNVTDMPKPSVPPDPTSHVQLSLGLEAEPKDRSRKGTRAASAAPGLASAQRKGTSSTPPVTATRHRR